MVPELGFVLRKFESSTSTPVEPELGMAGSLNRSVQLHAKRCFDASKKDRPRGCCCRHLKIFAELDNESVKKLYVCKVRNTACFVTAAVVVRPFPPLKSTKRMSSLRHYADVRHPSSRFRVLSRGVTDREPAHRTTGAM